MKRYGMLLPLLAIAACSVRPDGSNGQHRAFDLAGVDYQQAYRATLNFARTCHSGGGLLKHATVTNEIYTDTRKAAVRVAWGGGTMPEMISLAGTPAGTSVSVVVLGHGMWDVKELDAAQRSIETGKPSCR